MKKIILILLAIFVLFPSDAKAVPLAPLPNCEVTARVLQITKGDEVTNLKFNFLINIQILSLSSSAAIYKDDYPAACSDLYKINSVHETVIFNDKEQFKLFNKGDRITATLQQSGDEWSTNIFLTNVKRVAERPQNIKFGQNVLFLIIPIIITAGLLLILFRKAKKV